MAIRSALVLFICVLIFGSSASAGVIFHEDFEDGTADGISVLFGSYAIGPGLNGSSNGFRATGVLGGNILRLDGIPVDNIRVEADFVIDDSSFGDFEIRVNFVSTDAVAAIEGYRAFLGPLTSDNPVMSIARVAGGIGGGLGHSCQHHFCWRDTPFAS